MPWNILAGSNIGSRDDQQDRYLKVSSRDAKKHLLVVADGAGGHAMGGAAAEAAINYIKQNLSTLWLSTDPENFINELIIECNKKVLLVGDGDLACSTLVLVFAKEGELFWGHVGDSRFYLIRNREVVFQTTDHSMNELKKQQIGSDVDNAVGASSGGLYMCLGALQDITPDVASSVAREGDMLLLCSDGFWGQADMGVFINELSEQSLTNEALQTWIARAREYKPNSSDNITLVAAKYIKKPCFFIRLRTAVMNLLK